MLLAALLAQMPVGVPPTERGPFRADDLVEIVSLDRSIHLDIRYATPNNFLGRPVYRSARAYLQREAAEALVRAHRALARQGYGIVVFDGYRPWSVTKIFWDETPVGKRAFVADPAIGSRHNRGCAVDVTLYELDTGKQAEMPTDFDDFSPAAHPAWTGCSPSACRNRDLLRAAMEAEGFTVYENEWWHYDYRGYEQYRILNVSFEEIGR
jgi:D-alanyl-D-alanine dipeptidase